MRHKKHHDRPRDVRLEMIAETSAYLSWALRQGSAMPRIPTRRVAQGGFGGILRNRGMRAAVLAFWERTLASSDQAGNQR